MKTQWSSFSYNIDADSRKATVVGACKVKIKKQQQVLHSFKTFDNVFLLYTLQIGVTQFKITGSLSFVWTFQQLQVQLKQSGSARGAFFKCLVIVKVFLFLY